MCDLCGWTPCMSGCPNEPEVIVCFCDKCKGAIHPGEQFITVDDEKICEFCLDDMTKAELLEKLGIEVETAESE